MPRGQSNSPFDKRRSLYRRRREADRYDLYFQVRNKPSAETPRAPRSWTNHLNFASWMNQTPLPVAPQYFALGYQVEIGGVVGTLVGAYSDGTERWYRFRFRGECGLRVISQARLVTLVGLQMSRKQLLLPAGRTRGNFKQTVTPPVIYLPTRIST